MFLENASIFIPQPVFPVWKGDRTIEVLRTDLLHEVVSGNKWFKLQYYLKDAMDKGYKRILTFGGSYSNHIVATAFAAQKTGLKSVGVIRGELSPKNPSYTLHHAQQYGMKLEFVSREEFNNKAKIASRFSDYYIINEGGYGILGAQGASEMLTGIANYQKYDFIVLAVGTATTMAGIINAASLNQKIYGISVMKNNNSLLTELRQLLNMPIDNKKYSILHDYHFGGYAKKATQLIDFMNMFYRETDIPTDFVYTAKAAYALKDLCVQNILTSKSNILFIHTGGLQGNMSLPKGLLMY